MDNQALEEVHDSATELPPWDDTTPDMQDDLLSSAPPNATVSLPKPKRLRKNTTAVHVIFSNQLYFLINFLYSQN
jgi:hypothetical protein